MENNSTLNESVSNESTINESTINESVLKSNVKNDLALLTNDNQIAKLMLDEIDGLSLDEIVVIADILYDVDGDSISDFNYDCIKRNLDENSPLKGLLHEDTIEIKNNYPRSVSFVDRFMQLVNIQYGKQERYYKTLEDFPLDIQNLMQKWEAPVSIKAYRDVNEFISEVLNFYYMNNINDIIVQWKYNGWNVASYYSPLVSGVVTAHNRSRNTHTYIDMTDILSRIISVNTSKLPNSARVLGELILTKEGKRLINNIIDTGRVNYKRKFVSERSALTAIVSGAINEILNIIQNEYYIGLSDILKYRAFDIEIEGQVYEDYVQKYNIMKDIGFDVVDSVSATSLNDVVLALPKLEQSYADGTEDNKIFDIDGVVLFPRYDKDVAKFKSVGEIYSLHKKAYKAGQWSKKLYTSKIKEFTLSNGSKYFRIKAIIEPVMTNRGYVSVVPLYYKDILDNQLDIGDTIVFSDRGDIAVIFERKI